MQAERGAAQTELSHRKRLVTYGVIVIVWVTLDQITKAIAKNTLEGGIVIRPFNDDLVWFLYVQNPGFAFGLKLFPVWVLAIISAIAAALLVIYVFAHRELTFRNGLSISLITAGALGNMIDRVFRKEVIDFVSIDLPDWLMDRFPVFNLADSAISVGVVLVLLFNLLTPNDEKAPQPLDETRIDERS